MMTTETRTARGGQDGGENMPSPPFPPQFYPGGNFQGPMPPTPPWLPPGASGSWPPPWGFPGAPPGWSPPPPGRKVSPSRQAPQSDEYTVDTMRRIYNDDDGRVEIQRVKVQRRQPDTPGAVFPPGSDSMSVVPVGAYPLNEKRPPPRKNKLKRQMELMQSMQQNPQGAYPWYPYMPCMPYPYPYPYYYGGGAMWPPTMPAPSLTPWAGSDDSERSTSRQDSLPTTIDSQRLDSRMSAPSRNSHSPMFPRSPSPAATTIAPSDSVSVRSYKDEESLTCSFRGPTPPPRTRSRASRAIMAPGDFSSEAGDKSSSTTTCTDIVPYIKKPPRRKNRKSKAVSLSDQGSSLDQKDTDSISDRSSVTSELTCDDSSKLDTELSYALKKFEKSVDVFKTKISDELTPVNTPPRSPSPIVLHSKDSVELTKDGNKRLSSEDTMGEDTDSYANNPESVSDMQPSTTSLCSLPLLETAPLDSASSSAKVQEINSEISDINNSIPNDNLQNSQSMITDESKASSHKNNESSTQQQLSKKDSETKTVESQTEKASEVSQEDSAPPVITSITPTSTQDTSSNANTGTSEWATASESQSIFTATESHEKDLKEPLWKLEVSRSELDGTSGRDSRLSSSTFFSIRPSDEPLHIDTDSTDIFLPTTDATTADEGGDGTDWTASSPVLDDGDSYKWVLQQPGEIPDVTNNPVDREDERRNAWRAEVSLWRARLVVSLCRGRGLDRQDWATFHLLVHHPLTLDLKLSMLHAPRICVANSAIGAALVRVALIHLAQYGETLLQPEGSRQHGWRSIKVDPNQSWSPVKGAMEILKTLGYKEREDGVLRYPRRPTTEVSVLARLTLDMLVLAEELRLYLTGTHQYPTNISDLFFPTPMSTPALSDGSHILPDLPRPPSSAGSYSFMSARSNASLNDRPDSRASSVTDDETETLQASVKPSKASSKKAKQPSSSEEEVTLKEELVTKPTSAAMTVSPEIKQRFERTRSPISSSQQIIGPRSPISSSQQAIGPRSSSTVPLSIEQSAVSLDMMSSLPDLQSIRSSTVSLMNHPIKELNQTATVTPVPDTDETKDNPEEHIYEEIDVIRQQVQALRASSVPVDAVPPPLPPKKKVSSGGEDDSGLSLTYPQMEWTSASMPGSLRGGSTGARRKKRRAPMPPDFMPRDWKPYENRPDDQPKEMEQNKGGSKSKSDYRRSLNPFYEDIDSVKKQVKEINKSYESRRRGAAANTEEGNPFDKDEYVASGYVGKNPFYEDIDEDAELDIKQTVSHSSAAPSPNTEGTKLCPMGSLSELQDDSIILKSKRKAPKPPPTPDPGSRTATPQPDKSVLSPHTQKSPSSPQPPNVPPPNPPVSPQPPKSPSSPQTPKSSSPQPPKSPSSPQPPKHPTTPPPRPPVQQQQNSKELQSDDTSNNIKISIDKHTTELCKTSDDSQKDTVLLSKIPKECVADGNKDNIKQSTEEKDGVVADGKKDNINQSPDGKDGAVSDKEKARQVVSKAIKTSLNRLQIQHPAIPPPPPPPKLDDDDETISKPQSILDDIPYMDANEINTEVAKLTEKKVPQSPQYEIPELPGKDGVPPAPPLSPTTMRQTALLLSGQRSVPFIDESDLPPDCPPPPPPTSPPDSPSETPKASPSETPHTSPPETPHVSPPESPHTSPTETPHASRSSSPVTVKEPETLATTDSTLNETNTILLSAAKIVKSNNEETSEVSQVKVTSTTDGDKASMTPHASIISPPLQNASSLGDSQPDSEPPPLPPKTIITLSLKNDSSKQETYTNQSIQSSVSEERYEIPENPDQCDDSKKESDVVAVTLETLEEGAKEEDAKEENLNDVENSETQEAEPAEERYEIPEVVEERYEIPEVVKETALSFGPEGMPIRVGGPVQTTRMHLESVFGPPKPPRRRRNNSLPPPRPPKSMFVEEGPAPILPPKSATTIRPASSSTTTSSFVTASAGRGSVSGTPTIQGTPKPSLAKQRSKTRRSWPLIFCDCMYVNCKNYDDIK